MLVALQQAERAALHEPSVKAGQMSERCRRGAPWRLCVRLLIAAAGAAGLLWISHDDRFSSAYLWRLMGDKLPDVIAYAVLTCLVLLLRVKGPLAIGLLVAVASLDELTQPWFGRSCSLGDWLTDLTGILGVLAVYKCVRFVMCRRPSTEGVDVN